MNNPACSKYTSYPCGAHSLMGNVSRIATSVLTLCILTFSTTITAAPPPPLSNPNTTPEQHLGPRYYGAVEGTPSVSAAGNAFYTVPIVVPPGTNGMAPSVSLTYNSNMKNGPVGLGWFIQGASSRISRCPKTFSQDGETHAVNFTAEDRFCLDGHRLLLVGTGTYGDHGTEYRTEIDSFRRITAHGAAGNGPEYFIVESPNGHTMQYGFTADSRIEAQGKSTVYTWALNRVEDVSTNYYTIEYTEDNSEGSFYPDVIKYTGNVNENLTPYAWVKFEWENRDDSTFRYQGGSKLTPHPKRLNEIQTFIDGGTTPVTEYRLEYEMFGVNAASSPEGNQSRLKKIRRCDPNNLCQKDLDIEWWADANGIDAENYAYDLTVPADTTTVYKHQDLSNPRMVNARWHDFNGDGRPDYIYTQKNGTNPATQTASGTYTLMLSDINNPGLYNNATWTTPGISQYDNFDEIAFADVNGDGRTDLVVPEGVTSSGVANFKVALASSNNFSVQTWQGFSHAGDESEWFLYDMDGDKALDLVTLVKTITSVTPYSCGIFGTHNLHEYDIEVLVHTNSGTNFSSAQSWLTGLEDEVQLADMNGDGYVDVIEKTRYVYFNNASGFDPKLNSGSSGGYTPCWGGIYWAKFFDFNKDGLADRYEGTSVDYFTGESFVSAGASFAMLPFVEENGDTKADSYGRSESGSGPTKESAVSLLFMRDEMGAHSEAEALLDDEDLYGFQQSVDLDGDGISEYTAVLMDNCQTSTPYGYCETSTIRVYGNDDPPHHLIRKITTGFGLETEFTFKQIADPSVYEKGTSSVLPIEDVKEGVNVVSKFKRSDGVGGYDTTEYFYESLKRDHGGRGLLGFAKITSNNATKDSTTITEYEQQYPYSSRAKKATIVQTSTGTVISDSETTYLVFGNLGAGPVFSYVGTQIEKAFNLTDGRLLSTTTRTINGIDSYGNVIDAVTSINDVESGTTHQTEIVRTYTSDETSWRINQLDATVTKFWLNGVHDSAKNRHENFFYLPGNGKLDYSVSEQGVGLDLELTQRYGYDSFGNLDEIEVSGPSIISRTATIQYDSQGRFPVSIKNPANHIISRTWDGKHGLLLSEIDPNNLVTSWDYDSFGHQWRVVRPDTTSTETKSYEDQSSSNLTAVMYTEVLESGSPPARVFQDRLARKVRVRTRSFDGTFVNVDTVYDAHGRIYKLSEPYFSGSMPAWSTNDYDHLGRLYIADRPDSTLDRIYVYDGALTTIVEPNWRISKQWTNALGQLVLAEDSEATQTKFEYDAQGNRVKVISAYGSSQESTVSYTFDRLGRLVESNDPDHGVYTYGYSGLGELVWEKSPKLAGGPGITAQYDLLSRMVSRNEPEGITTWSYDNTTGGNLGIGRLHSESQNGFNRTYSYGVGNYGRLTSTSTTIDSTFTYTTSVTYGPSGKVATESYPSGFTIAYTYNPLGFLERVQNTSGSKVYYQLTKSDAKGRIETEWLGDGSSTATNYEGDSGRITELKTTNGASTVQHFTYAYDDYGNMKARNDQVHTLTEDFSFDGLDRLVSASVPGNPTVNYDYDVIGNITAKSDYGSSYSYNSSAVHAVTEVLIGTALNTLNYDANGNLFAGTSQPSITWSSYDKPTHLSQSGLSYEFHYGPDRQRYKKTKGSQQTHYLGNYEKVTDGSLWGERHIVQAYGRIVMLRETLMGFPEHKYVHLDHLGSVTALTKESDGSVLERFSYDAWGSRRNASDWVSAAPPTNQLRGYTGHEHLSDIGVIHMNGRIYDPALGRMLSPDPVTQSPLNGRNYNRYTYASNNPLRNIDPSGLACATASAGYDANGVYISTTICDPGLPDFYFLVGSISIDGSFGQTYIDQIISGALGWAQSVDVVSLLQQVCSSPSAANANNCASSEFQQWLMSHGAGDAIPSAHPSNSGPVELGSGLFATGPSGLPPTWKIGDSNVAENEANGLITANWGLWARQFDQQPRQPSLMRDIADLISNPGQYFSCSVGCASEIFGVDTASKAAVVASGFPVIPVGGKPANASKGTSVASAASRALFGDLRFPKRVPAPTLKLGVGSKTTIVGSFVGRWVPVAGLVALLPDARSLDQCIAGCLGTSN